MRFTKMQGCGNDYVVMDGRELSLTGPERGKLAKRLCLRRFGIGADGLLILREGKVAAFEMEMYNPDGTRGESCGNGLRCAGEYLWEKGWTREKQIQLETMGEVRTLERVLPSKTVRSVESIGSAQKSLEEMGRGEEGTWRVNMGTLQGEVAMHALFGQEIFSASFGNPHAVTFPAEGEPGEWPMTKLGPRIEMAKEFPNRTNVEFVKVVSRNEIVMRVWERGAGETLSCGTGACAAAAVCMQKHLTDDEITVKLLGGELWVEKNRFTGQFFLTGPAVTVYEGEL